MTDKPINSIVKVGIITILLTTGSTLATYSHAQISDSGFYLGAGGGGTTYNGFDNLCRDITGVLPGIPVETNCQGDETVFGWKLFGGWRFNPYLALEGGYADLGEANGDTVILGLDVNGKVSANALFAELIGSLPLGKSGRLFGKIGMAGIDSELTTDSFAVILRDTPTTSFSDNSTDIVYGLGAEYGFTQKVIGRIEWERFEFGDGIDLFSASIIFPLDRK